MNMSQVKRSTCRECEVIRMDDKKMEIMISMNYKIVMTLLVMSKESLKQHRQWSIGKSTRL